MLHRKPVKPLQSLMCAVQFLTRIPVRLREEPDSITTRGALVCFPLAGWLIGAMLFLLWRLLTISGSFTPLTAAVIIVTAETLLTGALHLDGLADTCDALFSPASDRGKKLAVMKDSRIGVMGATALVLALLLKTALLSQAGGLLQAAVVFLYPVVGRWCQVALYRFTPYVRPGGTGAGFAREATGPVFLCATILIVPLCTTMLSCAALAASALAMLLVRRSVSSQLGGVTGDVLGAATVMTETVYIGTVLLLRPLAG